MNYRNQKLSFRKIKQDILKLEQTILKVSNVEMRSELTLQLVKLEAFFDADKAKKRILAILDNYFRAKGLLAIAEAEKRQGKLSASRETFRWAQLTAMGISNEYFFAMMELAFLRCKLEESLNNFPRCRLVDKQRAFYRKQKNKKDFSKKRP